MLGNIIAAIVIGIIAGYLGRLLLPGRDPMGFVGTVIAGIVGALVGYFLFTSLLGIGDDEGAPKGPQQLAEQPSPLLACPPAGRGGPIVA